MDTLGQAEREMLDWLDRVRGDLGLVALRPIPCLMAAAWAKCGEVAERGTPAHTGGRWGSPSRLQAAFGLRARTMGAENLAAYADARRAFLALMASPGHRANIVHPAHDAVGVAVRPWPGTGRGVAVCQEFAGGVIGCDGASGGPVPAVVAPLDWLRGRKDGLEGGRG